MSDSPALPRLAPLQEQLRRAAANRTPILIGPWIEEVGYELLYRIPFVRWIVTTLRLPREHCSWCLAAGQVRFSDLDNGVTPKVLSSLRPLFVLVS